MTMSSSIGVAAASLRTGATALLEDLLLPSGKTTFSWLRFATSRVFSVKTGNVALRADLRTAEELDFITLSWISDA